MEGKLDHSNKATSNRSAGTGEGEDLRLRRIRDFLDEALAKDNALEANLGAINSDLMVMAYQLRDAIDDALAEGSGALDDFRNLVPALGSYLGIIKQIDRFAQLELRVAGARAVARKSMKQVTGESKRRCEETEV
jgi:hypothetical protein